MPNWHAEAHFWDDPSPKSLTAYMQTPCKSNSFYHDFPEPIALISTCSQNSSQPASRAFFKDSKRITSEIRAYL